VPAPRGADRTTEDDQGRPVPTYQYACTECDHSFEQFQSFTDDALTECPQCHGRLRKLFNAVGVVFKGSGFYRTDSRSESGSTEKKDSGSKSDSVNGSSEKKASTKPSTSTESSSTTSSAAAAAS
jgi:putative FmdB family regulatory protein